VRPKIRRSRAGYEAVQAALRQQKEQLEGLLLFAPSEVWPEAAEKAAYLLDRFAESRDARPPRCQKLINSVLEDFPTAE
jgi:hypothetical protein